MQISYYTKFESCIISSGKVQIQLNHEPGEIYGASGLQEKLRSSPIQSFYVGHWLCNS